MLLQEGDFILRRGVGMTSDLIAGALNESRQITHGGILVRDGSERWMVIHALSAVVSDFDGVQVQRLEEFAEAGMEGSLTVVRSRHAGFAPGGGGIASFGAELAERARFYLEKRVPFDFDFDSASSNAFYCSEFLVRTYQDVFGKDIFSYTPQGIPRFSSFFQPEYFELVLDHGNPLQEDSR
ncbi:MAG: hypothetical protein K9L68_07985 [Spirochaetales bacterium]|nr:hypothetical protein [Spirochaetales bacterium]MCF7938522.1 hypothetical protein [Spirochaetales bacterium]